MMKKHRLEGRKIVFINRFFYPDHSATSQILSDLAFDLAEKNYDVRVITSRLKYDSSDTRLSSNEMFKNVHIMRVWTSGFGRGGLLGRSVDYLTFYAASAITLWGQMDSNTTVVAKTDPPLISVVAALVTWLRGGNLINWLQDVFPEIASVLGIKVVKGPVYKFLKYFRNRSLHAADLNIVLGAEMAKYIESQGVPRAKISILTNWADCSEIKPVENRDNLFCREWGLHGKFVIGYSGNIGRAHEFETILSAAVALKADRRIVFLFIGGGAQRSSVENAVAENQLDSVIFKPYQSREKLDQSLGCADVHLVSLNPKLEGLIVPSKIYGILAAGRPTIFVGDTKGEISQILRKGDCGFAVASGDDMQLIRKIRSYVDDASLRRCHSINARRISMSHFDKSVCVERFVVMHNALICNKLD